MATERVMSDVVALSGGKDSTAMALRLAEVEQRDYVYFCTPTGDELPEMVEHWRNLECLLGRPIVRVSHRLDLAGLIGEMGALPNHRMRWCTRMLKIEPCQVFLSKLENPTIYVGLRADEPDRKGAIYTGAQERYPFREWGWGIDEVMGYLRRRGIKVPRRTDCARCYHQRLGEWFNLWRDHPNSYASAEAQEEDVGHTFRSPGRDTWPVKLRVLRGEFERGKVPKGADVQPGLFDDDEAGVCRACSL